MSQTDVRARPLALVTGSSRGLGAATAIQLVADGYDLVVTYRSKAVEAEAVAQECRVRGAQVHIIELDLEDTASIDSCFAAISDLDRGLDVLVANAAATSFRPLIEAKRSHLERTFAISVFGFHQLVLGAIPLMRLNGGGRIVAVSGADTRTWIPGHGLLAAAKAAMESMVKYFGCELAGENITTIGISPGWMDGDSIKMMLGPFYDMAIDAERETHPMKQAVTPAQAAEAIALLCRPEAQWLNGSIVESDGAGVFAFAGRYSVMGAKAALAGGAVAEHAAAPSVPQNS
ncbi:MAG: SDR family oxidoreductase [Acidimicrobiia bacterium]